VIFDRIQINWNQNKLEGSFLASVLGDRPVVFMKQRALYSSSWGPSLQGSAVATIYFTAIALIFQGVGTQPRSL
jgi:hypothetical protein